MIVYSNVAKIPWFLLSLVTDLDTVLYLSNNYACYLDGRPVNKNIVNCVKTKQKSARFKIFSPETFRYKDQKCNFFLWARGV